MRRKNERYGFIIAAFTFMLFPACLYAQVSRGIGTLTPNAKAVLDLTSTTQGLLAPRMTTAQRTAIPATASEAGLMVFDQTLSAFFFYDGTQWQQVQNGLTPSPWTNSGTNIYPTTLTNRVGIGTNTPADTLDVVGGINTNHWYRIGGTKILVGNSNSLLLGFNANGSGKNTGSNNTFLGNSAGYKNVGGSSSVYIGTQSGYNNTSGSNNVFIGNYSGYNNTTQNYQTAVGYYSGYNITSGYQNTFIGAQAGYYDSSGALNTAVGMSAGFNLLSGFENSIFGTESGYSLATGANNAIFGFTTAFNLKTGSYNTVLGTQAGYTMTSPSFNTFVGQSAGYYTTTGGNNTFVGAGTGGTNTSGVNNTVLGNSADFSKGNLSNATVIGYNAHADSSNTLILGGTGGNAVRVGIGVTYPTAQLDVTNVTTQDTKFHLLNTNSSSGNVGIELRSAYSTGLQYIDFTAGSTSNANSGTPDFTHRIMSSSTDLEFWAAPSLMGMDILNNGSIGIGTSAPNTYAIVHMVGSNSTVGTSAGVFLDIQNGSNTQNALSGIRFTGSSISSYLKTAILVPYTNGLWGISDMVFALNGASNNTVVSTSDAVMTLKGINGNVGIGTTTPDPSAQLEVGSTTRGFLPPRVTTAQRNAISSPAAGLVVYNTNTNCIEFYNGSAWVSTCATSTSNVYSDYFLSGVTASSSQVTYFNNFRASLASSGYNSVTLSGSLNTAGITCNVATVANQIAAALKAGTTTSYVCGANTWYIGTCGSGVEISVNVTVCNCSGYSLRPGIGSANVNWGGINGTTCSAPSQTITLTFQ